MGNSECGSIFIENFLLLLQHLHKAQGTEGIDLSIAIWSPKCQKSPVKYAMQRKLLKEECPKASEFRAMKSWSCTITHLYKPGERGLQPLSVCDWFLLPSPKGYPCTPPRRGEQRFKQQTAQAQMQEQLFAVILDHFFCWSRAQPQEHWNILSNGYCENFLMCSFVLKDFLRQLHNRKDFLVWFKQCLRLAGQNNCLGCILK